MEILTAPLFVFTIRAVAGFVADTCTRDTLLVRITSKLRTAVVAS